MKNKLFVAGVAFLLVGLSACTPQALVELTSPDAQKKFLEDSINVMKGISDYITSGTVTSVINEENSFEMDMEMKKKGENSEATITTGEKYLISLKIDNRTYFSNDGTTWFEVVSSDTEGSSFVETEQFSDVSRIVDPEEYEYKGIMDCDGQRCHVFEFSKEDGTYRIYFTGDMRVRKFEITSPETNGTFNMRYENVSLKAAPSNAERLEGIQGAIKVLELYTPLLEEAGVDFNDLQ